VVEEDGGTGYQLLAPEVLSGILDTRGGPRLVILNSRDASKPEACFVTTAERLLLAGSGIAAVVATQFDSDTMVAKFNSAFLSNLMLNVPIQKAMTLTRLDLQRAGSSEWMFPILYTQFKEGRLRPDLGWPPERPSPPERPERRARHEPAPLAVKSEYVVWYGTNRRPYKTDKIAKGYSAERDSKVHYGSCRVFIPGAHKIGSLGSPWFKRIFTRRDDRLKLREIKETGEASFWQQIARRLSKLDRAKRHAVIFVHGYNVSFNDAALRAAQIGFDLSIEGTMAFFSWPSQGTIGGYLADSNDAVHIGAGSRCRSIPLAFPFPASRTDAPDMRGARYRHCGGYQRGPYVARPWIRRRRSGGPNRYASTHYKGRTARAAIWPLRGEDTYW
jgi:Alpha/beta hydrolase of unknown function (DUF900)